MTGAKVKKTDIIEVAKSGRAECRGCGAKLEKGVLRFGLVDFGFSESGSHRWYHLACAREKALANLHAVLARDAELLAPHREAIDAALGEAGDGAATGPAAAASSTATGGPTVLTVLERDAWPGWLAAAKLPKRKIPSWVKNPAAPLTKEGLALDEEARELLVGAMMTGTSSTFEDFVELLDPASYRDFAFGLFRCWANADAHMGQRWVIDRLVAVVDDDMAEPLGEAVERLQKRKKTDAVRQVLDALAAHGSPPALMAVQRLAQRYKYRGWNNPALAALSAEAHRRGISVDELEDLAVPTCGLDAHGTRIFSYGPRTYRLAVDDVLRILIIAEDDGTRLPTLPRPRAGDDIALVEEAKAELARIKRDIEAMLPIQARRLEGALSSGRAWALERWNEHVRRHPLMQVLAQRLVWALYDGDELVRTFRVDAEDQVTDANDEVIALEAKRPHVRLAHPADMAGEEREAWAQLFGDYEIVALFPQLARQTYVLGVEERTSTELRAFEHTPVELGPLHGRLNRADWIKGEVDDSVRVRHFSKRFGGDLSATAHLSPGFHPAGWDDEPQSVTHVTFHTRRERAPMMLKYVPPAVISEVIYDMNQLAG